MAEIRIARAHALGLPRARQLAHRWAEVAGQKLEMQCSYQPGVKHDVVRFRRPGAHGELRVTAEGFELHAKLGLLFGMFRSRIVAEIENNLDALLAHDEPLAAFEQGLARHEARRHKR